MTRILVVDDEPSLLAVLSALLKAQQFEVVTASDGEAALKILEAEDANFDLLLSDVRMSPMDGVELLKQAHEKWPSLVAVMLTAYTSVETAVAALKLGAYDYLAKPFKIDELLTTIQRALEYGESQSGGKGANAQPEVNYTLENIVAESKSMQSACEMIKRVSPTDTPVLIEGETGTGKEIIARSIHSLSSRSESPFLSVNCALLTPPILAAELFGQECDSSAGLFEKAKGGSLLLKEIDSIPLDIQESILAVLKNRSVTRIGGSSGTTINVRILSSANTDLTGMVSEGQFLADLRPRVAVLSIEVSPLRDRKEDVLPLVAHFILEYLEEGQKPPIVDSDVLAILESYTWPGNVRELGNIVKHAMMSLQDGNITKDSLPSRIANVRITGAVRAAAGGADAHKGKALKAFLKAKSTAYIGSVKKK